MKVPAKKPSGRPITRKGGRVGMNISVSAEQRDEIHRRAVKAGMSATDWLLDGRIK